MNTYKCTARVHTSVPDILRRNAGTTFVVCAISPAGKAGIEDHVNFENWQKFGQAIVVGQRYILGLVVGMLDVGLVIA